MKKMTLQACLVAMIAIGVGCGNGNSSSSSDTASTTSTDTAMSGGSMNHDNTSNTSSSDTSMKDDREFALEAASGGLMEVELGKMAQTNGASMKVKDFGKMMVADHSKANDELKAVASKKGMMLPPNPNDKMQKHIDNLRDKKGAEFDKDYVDMMVDDHKEDIEKFEKEASDGKDADVKAFATKTLPVLRKHLQAIQAIKDGMK